MHNKNLFPSCILLLLLSSLLSSNVVVAKDGDKSGNPFTPKGYLIRYWKKHVTNDLPKPWFLLNKASPLNAAQYATYTKLVADQNALTTHLQSFCSSANLMCAPDLSPSLEKHTGDVHFTSYVDKNFTNYGTKVFGLGFNSFKNYSDNGNVVVNSFRRYGRDSPRDNKFDNYAPDTNVPDQSFNSYSTNTPGGSGQFNNYAHGSNVPDLRFTSYSDLGTGGKQEFKLYADDGNAGQQSFKRYGKDGNGADSQFTTYGNNTNVDASAFTNYGQTANGENQKANRCKDISVVFISLV